MRAAAMSVWIFINLVCFGMCGYLYLIWSQYWMYLEKQRIFNRPSIPIERDNNNNAYEDTYSSEKYFQNGVKPSNHSSNFSTPIKSRRSAAGVLWSNSKSAKQSMKSSEEHTRPPGQIIRKTNGSPRFPNNHKIVLELDNDKYLCEDLTEAGCGLKSTQFKELLLKEFHRVLMTEGNVFKSGLDSHNQYNVKYERGTSRRDLSGNDIICALHRIPLRTVTAHDEPFASNAFHIPNKVLQQNRSYNTCAVVTSAGALLGSNLGSFIDSHDMVLRFNNAPTENYTEDVGTKSTFRILNSQVVSKPEYDFLNNPLFKDVSILIWDPANFSSSLEEWYEHPDFPLFPVYKKLLEQNTGADVHLLHPAVLWDLWSVLQDSTPYRLRRNPPSSGFIGLWFALHRCNRVRMFEYVPSVRATRRCHYHASRDDVSCTLGAWHPLAQEKAVAERIRDNHDIQVFQRGYIDVPGFRSVTC